MSLKPIWKERALTRLTALPQDTSEWGPSPLAGFKLMSLAEIRAKMGDALKARMPMMAQAVDDPTSNISSLLDSIAAVDLDLWKQMEALAMHIEEKGVKLK